MRSKFQISHHVHIFIVINTYVVDTAHSKMYLNEVSL